MTAADPSGGAAACPSCGEPGMTVFHEQDAVPTNSCLLLDTAAEARAYPRGAIRLGLCTACGFISNVAFDESLTEYSGAYEETQGFSPRFRQFARDLAARWIDTYDIRGKTVLEIGCGKGEFLALLCEAGGNRGVGVDPAYVPERMDSPAAERLEFIQDRYSPAYAHLEADVVVCRHTLEHISPVRDFLRLVRQGVGARRDTIVLFELPDVLRVLDEVAFWDVYYEHCSYFSPGSLARLFRREGFDLLDVSLDFDDQYILLEARPSDGPTQPGLSIEDDLQRVASSATSFQRRYAADVARRRSQLDDIARAGKRAVIWGAGSKGVAYLSSLGVTDEIPYAVDINPFKHGKFMAGTGQQIVPPKFLTDYVPDVVIVMNEIYTEEIRAELDGMGVGARLVEA